MTDAGAERRRISVVDASVSLKWALDDEEDVERAVALRDAAVEGAFQLVAPSLWAYEVVNGLVSASRRVRVDPSLSAAVIDALFSVGVRLVDPAPAHVYEVATRWGLTAYDAAYVALAEALRCPLWTADGPLRGACRNHEFVRWIGEF